MLYRIRTDHTTEWVNSFGKKDFALLVEHGRTADDLPWEPAERIADGDTIRLALRYGVPSRVGLVVDVGDLVPLDHRDQVLKAHADWLAARPAYRKQVERLEPIMPGGLAHHDHLDEAVDASVRETINRAHAEFLEAIESPANTTLVRHWRSLGGRVPEPIGTD
ncbi:hypothetical protein [Promicromonospora sp. MEB111]|uniref:hypothetical protein n=1 Tax=Promicromonospora sp. MEB111 TaxID=3040301 RepID=UPI00254A3C3D|nr:hypothetical protein [Promicromonospora sp. MEB111]